MLLVKLEHWNRPLEFIPPILDVIKKSCTLTYTNSDAKYFSHRSSNQILIILICSWPILLAYGSWLFSCPSFSPVYLSSDGAALALRTGGVTSNSGWLVECQLTFLLYSKASSRSLLELTPTSPWHQSKLMMMILGSSTSSSGPPF